MEIHYANNKIKKQLSSATEIKRTFGLMAKKVSVRLEEIRASPNLAVLIQLPAANCHALSGDKKGEWALDISGNHRMLFEISHDPVPLKDDSSIDTIKITDITITRTTDYH